MTSRNAMTGLLIALFTFGAAPVWADGVVELNDSASERARANDPSADRGFLSPHAQTQPQGEWALRSIEVFYLGAAYGLTDSAQVSFGTTLPFVEGLPLAVAGSAKWAFFRNDSTVISLGGHVMYGTQFDGVGLGFMTVDLLLDHYLDEAGRFGLHAGLQAGGSVGAGFEGGLTVSEGAFFVVNAGVTAGLTNRVKLLVESQLPAYASSEGFAVAPLALVNYGVRIHGDRFAGDIGFVRPVGEIGRPFVMGVPFVSFTARF